MKKIRILDLNEVEISSLEDDSFLDIGMANFSRSILVKKKSKLHYVLVLEEGDAQVKFIVEQGSFLYLSVLVVGSSKKISADIQVSLQGNQAMTEFYCVSLLEDGADVVLNTGISIEKNCIGAEGNLLEENLLLGDPFRFRTTPLLDIYSDDVRASHAAKTHKLNSEKLFYLQSKGISEKHAQKLFVEAYINKIFSILPDQEIPPIQEEKSRLLDAVVL